MGTEICGCSSPFYRAAWKHAVSPLPRRIPDHASKRNLFSVTVAESADGKPRDTKGRLSVFRKTSANEHSSDLCCSRVNCIWCSHNHLRPPGLQGGPTGTSGRRHACLLGFTVAQQRRLLRWPRYPTSEQHRTGRHDRVPREPAGRLTLRQRAARAHGPQSGPPNCPH